MPVASIKNILRMADRCGIVIPKSVTKRFNGDLEEDIKAAKELIEMACNSSKVEVSRREKFVRYSH